MAGGHAGFLIRQVLVLEEQVSRARLPYKADGVSPDLCQQLGGARHPHPTTFSPHHILIPPHPHPTTFSPHHILIPPHPHSTTLSPHHILIPPHPSRSTLGFMVTPPHPTSPRLIIHHTSNIIPSHPIPSHPIPSHPPCIPSASHPPPVPHSTPNSTSSPLHPRSIPVPLL